MKKILLILLLAYNVAHAQIVGLNTVVIKGNEPSYSGKELQICAFANAITSSEKTLAKCKVQENGDFMLKFQVEDITPCFMHLGVYKGTIYVEPEREYSIKLPPYQEKTKAEEANPFFQEDDFFIGIVKSDKTELNLLINKFHYAFNDYVTNNYVEIIKKGYNNNVKKVISKLDSVYPDNGNAYFKEYKKYQYALLLYMAYQRNDSFILSKYFYNQPVKYNNPAYLNLLSQIASDYFLKKIKAKNVENKIPEIIMKDKSYLKLNEVLKHDILLGNDSLREIVILRSLFDSFYENQFPKNTIIAVTDSLIKQTKFEFSKEAALQMKEKFSELLEGTPAPDFSLYNINNELVSLSKFKGKFVYLNFYSSESYTCTQQLPLLKNLVEKYNQFYEVVTVCTDYDFSKFTEMMKSMKYKWTLLSYKNNPSILKTYKIRTFPTYYLIGPEGNLIFAPAPSPIEDFDMKFGEVYREYEIQKARQKR